MMIKLPKPLRNRFRFSRERQEFLRLGGVITHDFPIYSDYNKQAGTAKGHYFHQDLLVASMIHDAAPARHLDVGSSVEGFVAHVASFRNIEIFDIRPLTIEGHPRIRFVQGDLMRLDPQWLECTDSLSCLHALEHFGLGRYGDPIDPQGHLKGFANMCKMLKPGGTFYLGFPIGKPTVHFNAHRVFHPMDAPGWAKDASLELVRYDYVDDQGDLHTQQNPAQTPPLDFGCGIYTFRKLNSSAGPVA
jgi:hypothetical protein